MLGRLATNIRMNHTLSEVNLESRIGVCAVCGPVDIWVKPDGKRGCKIQRKEAVRRYRDNSGIYRAGKKSGWGKKWKKAKHRRFAKPGCERCGFIPRHMCQMDVHHKDRNHKNNNPDNLETLCALCHRLEHLPDQVKKDYGLIPGGNPVVDF